MFLYIPIKEFIIETFYIIKNLKNIDFDNYLIYMGLGIFFCISIYAGYTYIYTNFSIFLILLIIMSKLKRDITNNYKINTNKISFLMLHLGYGGIETSVINTANALSKEYEVELISFYNLKNNQVSRISKNINIKYLYNGEPNREEFKNAIKTHNYIKALKEGIKAVNILIKKKILIIKEIINNKSKYIISTRYDFTTLLNQYGKNSNIKIAQEHHYHNNNRKYINIIKYKYYNIDYLFALTKTLEEDYHKFLKYNHHTKVELIPNMLDKIPDKKSTLQNKNIITMSRLNYGKKNDDIIKAFSKIKDKSWKLYILGDGDEYTNLSNLIKELKLEDNVFLEGYVKKENIEKYLLNSSIFLMASLTEGLPMVLLEAMSYGIPCIAYETASGVKDIIENNYNGFIIKSRNEKEYINCIDKLTKNQSLREKFGKNAIKTANKFKEEEIIKKWNKVLRSEENVKKSA